MLSLTCVLSHEFSDKMFVKMLFESGNSPCKRASKTQVRKRIFKLIPIHVSLNLSYI